MQAIAPKQAPVKSGAAAPFAVAGEAPSRHSCCVDGGRFRSLDAWRGICALLVALEHLRITGAIRALPLIENGYRFVDFFFVLSGFVIASAYRERLAGGGLGTFLWRRVGRLYPLHLVLLGPLLAMALAGAAIGLTLDEFDHAALPANAALVHGWGFMAGLSWNSPSWSISAELVAYALFGAMARLLRGRSLDLALLALGLAALAVILLAAPSQMASTYDFGLARCLYGFTAGALAAAAWHRTSWRPKGEARAVLASVLAVSFLPPELGALIVPLFVWVVLVFASDAGRVSRLLMRPGAQRLGEWSYSIYMTHMLVALALFAAAAKLTPWAGRSEGAFSVVGPEWVTTLVTLGYLAAVLAVSRFAHGLIEAPARAWFRDNGPRALLPGPLRRRTVNMAAGAQMGAAVPAPDPEAPAAEGAGGSASPSLHALPS